MTVTRLFLCGLALVAAVTAGIAAEDPIGTRTALTVTPVPSSPDQPTTLTATVTASTQGGHPPTGAVEFLDDTTSLGVANLESTPDGQSATAIVTALSTGTHQLVAKYIGDDLYGSSLSNVVPQLVTAQ